MLNGYDEGKNLFNAYGINKVIDRGTVGNSQVERGITIPQCNERIIYTNNTLRIDNTITNVTEGYYSQIKLNLFPSRNENPIRSTNNNVKIIDNGINFIGKTTLIYEIKFDGENFFVICIGAYA